MLKVLKCLSFALLVSAALLSRSQVVRADSCQESQCGAPSDPPDPWCVYVSCCEDTCEQAYADCVDWCWPVPVSDGDWLCGAGECVGKSSQCKCNADGGGGPPPM